MIPTLLYLRPALRINKQLFKSQPRLFHQINRNSIPSIKPAMLNYGFNKTINPYKFKPIAPLIKPYSSATPTSNKGRYFVIGLAVFGAVSLIPDLFSSVITLAVLGIVALTYIFTFSFVFTIGLFVAALLALIAVVFSIPAIDLYMDTKKMIETNQLSRGWKVVPIEHRGLISRKNQSHSITHVDIKLDFDSDIKQNSLVKMYFDLGKVVGNSTALTGHVSLQRDCFGWWMYSIPFDLEYINEDEHHSAHF
ncbi:hypothetical protein HDV04_002706 [Boothiomyces sp. JEL0838]|nr:hypothetical protein HDV04_002706 [Boothiomyces sp. JEL0838]